MSEYIQGVRIPDDGRAPHVFEEWQAIADETKKSQTIVHFSEIEVTVTEASLLTSTALEYERVHPG
jgi:hypothetical protein